MSIEITDNSKEVSAAIKAAQFCAGLKSAGWWQRDMRKSCAPWIPEICATALLMW